MEEATRPKRKISVRKILQTIVTLIVTTACVVAITSASKKQDNNKIKRVLIDIINEKESGFVTEDDMFQLLFEDRHIDIDNMELKNVNLFQLKHIGEANPWVEHVEVYLNNKQDLNIEVKQRVPQYRVFDITGHSYYIDSTLRNIPLSDKYVPYLFVVNNVPVLGDNASSENIKAALLRTVDVIKKDTFWNAQVQEINYTKEHGLVLVPVVGNHLIYIGDSSRMDKKLNSIKVFYKKVLNKIGYDKYTVLDVRFKGQVVASPALPWKPPLDRAMAGSNMNWVNSIMGGEPQKPNSSPANALTTGSSNAPKPAAIKPAAATPPKGSNNTTSTKRN